LIEKSWCLVFKRQLCMRKFVLSNESQPSFLRALVAVLWSFAGIRKSSDRSKDFQNVRPEHVVVAGLLAAAVFVGGLILIVNLVISSAART
jgi:amino acid transporter